MCVCIWRGTIITLLQFFFLLCIGFYKITIIIIIIVIIRAEKWTTNDVFSPFPALSQFSFDIALFLRNLPTEKNEADKQLWKKCNYLVCSRLITESLTGSIWPIRSFKNVLLPTPLLPTTATVKKYKEVIRYRVKTVQLKTEMMRFRTWLTLFRTDAI